MSRRPRIAALGGGTGLASLLRGLKRAPLDITAIVTVADDGGSSGRLRRELGVLPPGDIRNCLVALADDESLIGPPLPAPLRRRRPGRPLLRQPLPGGARRGDRQLRPGDRGVQPGAEDPRPRAALHARSRSGSGPSATTASTVCGRDAASPPGAGPCRRVWLEPAADGAPARASRRSPTPTWCCSARGACSPACCRTSRCPTWPRRSRDAPALRVYICNVMTQPGETDGFDAADHLRAGAGGRARAAWT